MTGSLGMQRHLLAVAALLVAACTPDIQHDAGHATSTNGAHAMTGSMHAFEQANHRMHEDMAIEFTGNADIDFLRGMIPHHQGAIDMARIELEHGQDPEVRKLAEQIIAAQEQEIAMMQRWLAQREANPPHGQGRLPKDSR